jgi:hypothetical protein
MRSNPWCYTRRSRSAAVRMQRPSIRNPPVWKIGEARAFTLCVLRQKSGMGVIRPDARGAFVDTAPIVGELSAMSFLYNIRIGSLPISV